MPHKINDITLRTYTALFAQNIIRVIHELTGYSFEIQASSLHKGPYKSHGSFSTFMHFTGKVQGVCIITTETATAKGISNECGHSFSETGYEFTELFNEVVNMAVGSTLPEMEKKLGPLTQVPPYQVFGTIKFPSILSGNVDIHGYSGKIACSLLINLATIQVIEEIAKNLTEE
ncbi:hypothetical protein QA601_05690 [Chitinispirillales bacterium ANBcel5]|uniref:hypothetical protein n=1 Tax=Cellulosispirillum alkaliphilum TaxID=3039283 RepID=UPI002A58F65E|nr:hypothetical protein [Chitinispirillales bacterium ANBcel5]